MCLGYDPTITNSVWLVKVAIRSRRQSIWVTYTSRRYTAFYTGFRCMLQLYMDLASSRLACRDIQRIQRIQRIQLYSYTRYTAYSTIQPPSGVRGVCIQRLVTPSGRGSCRVARCRGTPSVNDRTLDKKFRTRRARRIEPGSAPKAWLRIVGYPDIWVTTTTFHYLTLPG